MSVYALLQGHIATAVGVMLELHCENSSYISNKKTDKQTANKVLQLCVRRFRWKILWSEKVQSGRVSNEKDTQPFLSL